MLRARDFAREMKQGLVLDTRAPEAFAGWRDAGMPLAAVVAARAVNTAARTR